MLNCFNADITSSLTRADVMEELITLTTVEPSIDIEERWRYKYPNIACELLTCDVPVLNEALAGILGKFDQGFI